jgi:hypothetical protein
MWRSRRRLNHATKDLPEDNTVRRSKPQALENAGRACLSKGEEDESMRNEDLAKGSLCARQTS